MFSRPRVIWYNCCACNVKAMGFIKADDPEGLGYDVLLISPTTCCEFAWYHEVISIKDCSKNKLMMSLYRQKLKEDKKQYE